ncbi:MULTISPECIES: helix-turn-helix transcriptional regulator [unclassified Leifsonia]|uniref:helix-turn-helix transcriptional regulator n=1 Tax=unclassified Leifsonia TaxID=2663824 RepID=UPI000A197937|nr:MULTISPECIES: helix-turn-helix transcriptional regulator [unclassified Leifsonia]QIZ98130.1 helix-turn-helix transcriptional regulator [Leifsonia sp. PS1209]
MRNRIREHRLAAGLTQSQLATDCGVSRRTIVALENDTFQASLTLALKLARRFHVPVEDIFSLD